MRVFLITIKSCPLCKQRRCVLTGAQWILSITLQSQLCLQAVQNGSAGFKLSVPSYLFWILPPAYFFQWFRTDLLTALKQSTVGISSVTCAALFYRTTCPGPLPTRSAYGQLFLSKEAVTASTSDRQLRWDWGFLNWDCTLRRGAEERIKPSGQWRTLKSAVPSGGHDYSETAYNFPSLYMNTNCLNSILFKHTLCTKIS